MSLSSTIRGILDEMSPPSDYPGTWDRSDPDNPRFNAVDWEPKDDAWMGAEIAKAIVDFVEGATLTVTPPAAVGTTAAPPGPFTGSAAPGSATLGDGGAAIESAFGTPLTASGVSPADDLAIATVWANGLGASLSTMMLEFPFSGTTMVPAPPSPSPIPTPVSGDMVGAGIVAPGVPLGLAALAAGLPTSQSNGDTADAISNAVSAILGTCTTVLASLPPPAGVAAGGSVTGWG